MLYGPRVRLLSCPEADAVDGRGDEDQCYEGEDGDVADAAEADAADAQVADGVHVTPQPNTNTQRTNAPRQISGVQVHCSSRVHSVRSLPQRGSLPGCFGCSKSMALLESYTASSAAFARVFEALHSSLAGCKMLKSIALY